MEFSTLILAIGVFIFSMQSYGISHETLNSNTMRTSESTKTWVSASDLLTTVEKLNDKSLDEVTLAERNDLKKLIFTFMEQGATIQDVGSLLVENGMMSEADKNATIAYYQNNGHIVASGQEWTEGPLGLAADISILGVGGCVAVGALGGTVGGIVGFFAGGVGTVPGAAGGAKVGCGAGATLAIFMAWYFVENCGICHGS